MPSTVGIVYGFFGPADRSIGNLTVNSLLKYLPQDIIEYIIYHEITHSIERKHNQKFWNLITKKFPNYDTKEKALLTYWFTIQKTIATNTDRHSKN